MISELIRALKAGEELKNAETWKSVQATSNALLAVAAAAIAGLGIFGVSVPVSNEQLALIVGGIAGLLNWYTTLATSRRIGLPAKPVDKPEDVAVANNTVSGGD